MDRALYVGMTGAMETLRSQTANNNNLANASTLGFRAELVDAQAVPVTGTGFNSRVNVRTIDNGWDSSTGAIMSTGNPLDVVMGKDNWLAVQSPDGSEAYTKAGNLHVDATGVLLTSGNLPVLSDSGPITIPPNSKIDIGGDGTISIVPAGSAPNALAQVGRLKVVTATPQQLHRRVDGLMAPASGAPLDAATGQVLQSGALEGSNVNLASSMVTMIQLARQFELQTKLMHAADTNAPAASSLINLNACSVAG